MRSSLHFGVATGVLAFLIAQPAMAQQCGPRIQALMPTAIALNSQPHPNSERIGTVFGEGMALIGVDEAACLRKLAELEALIRERQPGSGGGSGGGGDARGPSPAASAAAPSGGSQASPAPRAPLPAITPPTPFSQNMPSHLEFMPPVRRLEMEAMAEMVEAVRESGLAAVRVAAEADAAAPPALDGSLPNKAGEIAQSANETIATAEAFQQVLINEPGDVISAAMEDAFRVFDEANQAYDQIVQRAMDREMTDAELAAYTEQVKTALRRLEAARKGIQAVRMRQLKWLLEEKDGGMRAGFAAAFDQMEARHRYELRIVDDQCESIANEAQVRMARDYLNGRRNSTAMKGAQDECDAITRPVRDRHIVEEQNLFDQYRVTAEDVAAELRRATPRITRADGPLVAQAQQAVAQQVAPLHHRRGRQAALRLRRTRPPPTPSGRKTTGCARKSPICSNS